jgi:hypothetical protein
MITLETKEETKSQTTKVTQGFEGLVVAMELQKLGYQCWLKYLSTKGDEAVFQELGPLARDASAKNKRFEDLREDLVSLPSALTGAYIAFHDAAGTSEDFAQNPIQQEALETKKLAQRMLLTTAALGAVVHKSRPTAEGVLKELQNGEVTLPHGLLLKVDALGADA